MEKTVLITGATSGIGWETALLFAANGFRVVALGRDHQRLNALKAEIPEPEKHLFVVCDLGDIKAIKPALEAALHQCGSIDILVNNAGQGLFKPLEAASSAEEQALLTVNLLAPMEITRIVLPLMKKNGGIIVNVSSVAGKRTFKNLTAYCASKFGLIGFSNSLRRELKFHQIPISVSVVCPPATRTNFFKNAHYLNFEEDHPSLTLVDPQVVAREIWKAVRHKKREVIITPRAKLLDKMASIFPAFTEWLEDRVAKK